MRISFQLKLDDASQVAEVRRRVTDIASDLLFDETRVGETAIIVTELATNVTKYAVGGELVVSASGAGSMACIEVVAIDRGPGFDASAAQRDGFSSGGTMGIGLGTMRRMASEFDIYSVPGQGTIVRLVVREKSGLAQPDCAFEYGAIGVPHPGEILCGDAWGVTTHGRHVAFLLADGLGHGPDAYRAAQAACEELGAPDEDPSNVLQRAGIALKGTRGAAIAVASIDLERRQVRYAGVGNIAGAVSASSGVRQMVSHNGIVGTSVRKLQTFDYPFPEGAVLLMHSDGLASRWRIERYPAWQAQHPTVMAAMLYRDHARGSDDVTVLVARETTAPKAA